MIPGFSHLQTDAGPAPPTGMSIDNDDIDEASAQGTVVGTLSTTGGTAAFTYALVAGTGDTDNGKFQIDGADLEASATALDYETQTTATCRVQVTDANGFTFEKAFTITVNEVSASDPNIADVELLLHGNGADESTTITDSSPAARTLTASGAAKIDTAQKLFGSGSIEIPGSASDYVTLPNATPFDLNGKTQFTIEFALKMNGTPSAFEAVISKEKAAGGSDQITVRVASGGSNVEAYIAKSGGDVVLDLGAWSSADFLRYAIVRDDDDWHGYRAGTRESTTSSAGDPVSSSEDVLFGRYAWTTSVPGDFWLDEVRWTDGVARYTGASYTLATEEFPES